MVKRFFYDAEFVEDGTRIDILSFAMVSETGGAIYLIRKFAGHNDPVLRAAQQNQFVAERVLPEIELGNDAGLAIPAGKFGEVIHRFILRNVPPGATRDDVELWGYYSAYDHVVLAQLFGRMVDLPEPVPMFTCDLMQEMRRLGVSRDGLPDNDGEHSAYADAVWNRRVYGILQGVRQVDAL